MDLIVPVRAWTTSCAFVVIAEVSVRQPKTIKETGILLNIIFLTCLQDLCKIADGPLAQVRVVPSITQASENEEIAHDTSRWNGNERAHCFEINLSICTTDTIPYIRAANAFPLRWSETPHLHPRSARQSIFGAECPGGKDAVFIFQKSPQFFG